MNYAHIKVFIFLTLAFGALWFGCWFLSICPTWAEPPTFMSMYFFFLGGICCAVKEAVKPKKDWK